MSALPLTHAPPVPTSTTSQHASSPVQRGVVGAAGMIAFLASVTVLFAAVLIAYAIVRSNNVISMPALPWVFGISTFVILLATLFLQYAVMSARMMRGTVAHRALLTATGLTFLFFGLQAPGLVMLGQMHMAFYPISPALYALTFVLIGMHLLHVLGALVVLTIASLRSEQHHLSSGDAGHLRPLQIYCHYLALVWVVIVSTLFVLN